ncbi:MAG: hypothetical protein IJ274_13585, partial [Lachnospiraceae bacterium]|nr:hypothetical protein [Lachnospiraceae bacterium]
MEQGGLFTYVLEHMSDMVICFDQSGIVTYGNESAMNKLEYNYGLDGTPIWEVFPGVFWETEEGFATEQEFSEEIVEIMAYRQNKTCFPVEVSF